MPCSVMACLFSGQPSRVDLARIQEQAPMMRLPSLSTIHDAASADIELAVHRFFSREHRELPFL